MLTGEQQAVVLASWHEVETAFQHPALGPPPLSVPGLGVTQGTKDAHRHERLSAAQEFRSRLLRLEPEFYQLARELLPSSFPFDAVRGYSVPFVWGTLELVADIHLEECDPYAYTQAARSHRNGHLIHHYLAGHDTLADVISASLRLLYEHPLQLEQLDAVSAKRLVNEVIRYDPPVRISPRVALEDCVIGGTEIHAGQQVWLNFAAALRSPTKFENPEHFDLTRSYVETIGFGGGTFTCLGIQTAYALVDRAVRTFVAAYPACWVQALAYSNRGTFTQCGLDSLVLAEA